MANLDWERFRGEIWIWANGDDFSGTILKKQDEYTIPVEISPSDLEFLKKFPRIKDSLQNGKRLLISSSHAYLGIKGTEGPYAEKSIFSASGEGEGFSLQDSLLDLEESFEKQPVAKVLYKKLDFYDPAA